MGSAPGKIRTMATAPPTTVTTVTTARTTTATTTTTRGSGSSPDTQEADDFVMVPAHLTMDAAENRKKGSLPVTGNATGAPGTGAALSRQGAARRHTVSGDPHRPSNLPMQIGPSTEPIPVPTQKGKILDYWTLVFIYTVIFKKNMEIT